VNRRIPAIAGATVAALAFGATPALAKELTVDNDKVECKKADFTSIQAAVTAAQPKDKVKVCPGTYNEQVIVGPGKNGLSLESQQPLAAVIKAPATIAADVTNFKSLVRVSGSKDVSIRAFTISGPGPGPCDSIRSGVRVDNGGDAKIDHNHITLIQDTPFSGCQNGNAVQIGRGNPADGGPTAGTADVTQNTIDNYQKTGVVVQSAGSSAKVDHNDIAGIGPTPLIAQNGVQVGVGGTAVVTQNEISDNQYSPQTTSSTGVLLVNSDAGTVVSHNDIARNDEGIYVSTDGADVSHNDSDDNTFDGIGLIGANGNEVGHNSASGNGFDGIYAGSNSANNQIEHNQLDSNAEHDCHDDSNGPNNPPALVANLWVHDHGDTENRDGLCEGAVVTP
jgi:parallel beta-helix repeat protein